MAVLKYIPQSMLFFCIDTALVSFMKILRLLELISIKVIYVTRLIADYKINNDSIIKNLKMKTKETIIRHLEARYTSNEINCIKPACSEELFHYYYFFCDDDKTWLDLSQRLDMSERVIDIAVTNVGFMDELYYFSIIFITDSSRIFVYNVNHYKLYDSNSEYLYTINLNEVIDFNYTIETDAIDILNKGVPTNLTLKLSDDSEIFVLNLYGFTTELIRDLIWIKNLSICSENEMNMSITDRQKIKIKNLFRAGKISKEDYDNLFERSEIQAQTYRKKIWEESFHTYLEE
ncbi:MAG: hypothetical protein AB1782_16285 [Cyanobacteriota bacterium]